MDLRFTRIMSLTNKSGWAGHFRLRNATAGQAVRAALRVWTSGGQPPSRRSGALARREGGRIARPASHMILQIDMRKLL